MIFSQIASSIQKNVIYFFTLGNLRKAGEGNAAHPTQQASIWRHGLFTLYSPNDMHDLMRLLAFIQLKKRPLKMHYSIVIGTVRQKEEKINVKKRPYALYAILSNIYFFNGLM